MDFHRKCYHVREGRRKPRPTYLKFSQLKSRRPTSSSSWRSRRFSSSRKEFIQVAQCAMTQLFISDLNLVSFRETLSLSLNKRLGSNRWIWLIMSYFHNITISDNQWTGGSVGYLVCVESATTEWVAAQAVSAVDNKRHLYCVVFHHGISCSSELIFVSQPRKVIQY